MKSYNVHGKKLPVPSFFQVYNYGGGNGDKDREIVYSELTGDTPALINYYYINNKYPHIFKSHSFDDLSKYTRIGDVYNDIRKMLIGAKHKIYSGYKSLPYDFNNKVFLLDSGAFNIVKQIAASIDYDLNKFKEELLKHMKDYYDFADKLKVDIVVGFDLGGKYTEKNEEKRDYTLNKFLSGINSDEINNYLLEETAKYLSQKKNYHPFVLAAIHGDLQKDYEKCVDFVLEIEDKYNYKFWGFALGGIASYRQVDNSWYEDIDFGKTGKLGFIAAVTPARACRIVRSKAADRPIHALGCGGYSNIATNYFCGATSFDAASPVRRVGDGNLESTKQVYEANPTAAAKFSKYFVGGINMDGSIRTEPCEYVNLNKVKYAMPLCGCPSCVQAKDVNKIKDLYAMKIKDDEANYFSRQLMGLHAVSQHRKLCEVLPNYKDMESFCLAYPNKLNQGLLKIYEQL